MLEVLKWEKETKRGCSVDELSTRMSEIKEKAFYIEELTFQKNKPVYQSLPFDVLGVSKQAVNNHIQALHQENKVIIRDTKFTRGKEKPFYTLNHLSMITDLVTARIALAAKQLFIQESIHCISRKFFESYIIENCPVDLPSIKLCIERLVVNKYLLVDEADADLLFPGDRLQQEKYFLLLLAISKLAPNQHTPKIPPSSSLQSGPPLENQGDKNG